VSNISISDIAKGLIKAGAEVAAHALKHGVVLADEATQQKRLELCLTCPKFEASYKFPVGIELANVCGICKCPIANLSRAVAMKCRDKENPRW
jgi:cytochrome c2